MKYAKNQDEISWLICLLASDPGRRVLDLALLLVGVVTFGDPVEDRRNIACGTSTGPSGHPLQKCPLLGTSWQYVLVRWAFNGKL